MRKAFVWALTRHVLVNKYRLDKEDPLEVRVIDNSAVRDVQVKRLQQLRATRNDAAVKSALAALTTAARTNTGNLLERSIECARALATVGEISDALESVYGRYAANTQLVRGAYVDQHPDQAAIEQLVARAERFLKTHGRRPRILVAKLGQDGHDRGAHVIASGFADHGWDVDVGPLFQTPQEVVRQALESDVHVVGVSSQAAGHRALVPDLVAELRKQGLDDVVVICGGVIPPADYAFLRDKGVAAIFGPGTKIPTAVHEVLTLLENKQ